MVVKFGLRLFPLWIFESQVSKIAYLSQIFRKFFGKFFFNLNWLAKVFLSKKLQFKSFKFQAKIPFRWLIEGNSHARNKKLNVKVQLGRKIFVENLKRKLFPSLSFLSFRGEKNWILYRVKFYSLYGYFWVFALIPYMDFFRIFSFSLYGFLIGYF